MEEWVVRVIIAAATAGVGILTWSLQKKKNASEESSVLIADAMKIKEAYQSLYDDMQEQHDLLLGKFLQLEERMDDAIRRAEFWEGVSRTALAEHEKIHGTTPTWWPHTEAKAEITDGAT